MLNTFDSVGGAARAAERLQRGLRTLEIDARLLVQFKFGDSSEVICNTSPLVNMLRRLKIFLGLLPVRFYSRRAENNFSPALLPDNLLEEVASCDPDIIHLHWLGAGFFQVETLRKLSQLGKPLVWTLHDSWAFTGGCHVPFDCTRYLQRCGTCPVLGSDRERDLSRRTWERKKSAWRNLDLTVVTPSRWLADCARASSLIRHRRVEVIPNGIDTEVFKPIGRQEARRMLGLPEDKQIILFGAVGGSADPNKGFQLLLPALERLAGADFDLLALVFGGSEDSSLAVSGLPVANLGSICDDRRLAAAYAAADVFVVPSLLENLPTTVLEAMAAGTPCVAFRQGGVPEIIDHGISGYLAQPYESEDLARGIAWVLEDGERRGAMSTRARQKVEAEFSLPLMCRRYAELYRDVLDRSEVSAHG